LENRLKGQEISLAGGRNCNRPYRNRDAQAKRCAPAHSAAPGRRPTAVWNNRPVTLAAATPHDWFLLACAAGTVLLLLILIARVRLHPALALCVAALGLGLASGMPLKQVPLSFTGGVGNLLGHIAIVLGLGAILGRLVSASGGATALGGLLVENCGIRGLPWALLGLGILVGMPVFFEVGLVLLLPIVAAAASRSGRPPILVALPLLAGLSIVHGVLPPHPAAMLAATQFHADLGRTILFGLMAGLPAAALAGPILSWFLIRRWSRRKARGGPAEEGSILFADVELAAEAVEAASATEAVSSVGNEARAEERCTVSGHDFSRVSMGLRRTQVDENRRRMWYP
jgi:H+/gluconate symporter-like permease